MSSMATSAELDKMITSALEAVGLEYWGCEWFPRPARSLLRVYIDMPTGATIEDCGRASAQISAVLDVEDPIAGKYDLEVSSPGLNRPLFRPDQYARYIGEVIKFKLRVALDGRRNYKGKLEAIVEDRITVDIDGETLEVPFSDIEKANLVAS